MYFACLPCFPKFLRHQLLLERTGLEVLLKEPRNHDANSPDLLGFGNAKAAAGFVPFRQSLVKKQHGECHIAPGLTSWELQRC